MGQGGYGSVYVGIEEGTVIKQSHSRKYGAFLRELLLLSYLGPHPQLILLKDYNLEKSMLVLERWSFDLWSLLSSNKGTQNERRLIFHDILRGLAHLHSHGIVHSDIKSSNVMVKVENPQNQAQDGANSAKVSAVLIDMGLAGPYNYSSVELTTLPYRENNPVSSWHHDIYSAGLVGLELFAGVTWLSQPSYSSAVVVASKVSSLGLKLVLQGMLAQNRKNRLSAAEVLSVLTSEVVEPPKEPSSETNREMDAASSIARVLHAYQGGELKGLDTNDRDELEQVVVGLVEGLYYGRTTPLQIWHHKAMDEVLSKCPNLLIPNSS